MQRLPAEIYIGQTGRNFSTRYKEHTQAIRTNKPNFKYAQHILDTQHTYGRIENTMDVLHIERKGPVMNTWECYHICPRRNVPDFGRVFLMVKYTDITQNTYVQS
jgi:hypothetical protein